MEDNLMSTNTPNEKGTPQSRTYTVNDIAAILGIGRTSAYKLANSGFVERFPELSLFYRLFSPLNSEMICIFPYFCPYAESAREIREIFS